MRITDQVETMNVVARISVIISWDIFRFLSVSFKRSHILHFCTKCVSILETFPYTRYIMFVVRRALITFHIILNKTINKLVLHSIEQIFQYESFWGNKVRSHYYSVMFGTHNENNFLKAQTKENLELRKYQVDVTS